MSYSLSVNDVIESSIDIENVMEAQNLGGILDFYGIVI